MSEPGAPALRLAIAAAFVLGLGLLLEPKLARAQQPETQEKPQTILHELEQNDRLGEIPPALLDRLAERYPELLSPEQRQRVERSRARGLRKSSALSVKQIPSELDVVDPEQRLGAEPWPREDLNFRPGAQATPAGDVNGDGVDDWLYVRESVADNRTSDLSDQTPKTLLHFGGGTFSDRYYDELYYRNIVPAGTFVGADSRADAVALGNGELTILEGSASGYEDTGTTLSVSNPGTSQTPVDLDGDGFDDLVFTSGESITVLFGGATPGDVEVQQFSPSFGKTPSFSYIAGDIEEDGSGGIVRIHGNTADTTSRGDDALSVDIFEADSSRSLETKQATVQGVTPEPV
jgi:hypothetical protein